MQLKKLNIELGDNFYEVTFICDTTYKRTGFSHNVTMLLNDEEIEKCTINYVNRTWEAFQYQTAMLGALEKYHNYIYNMMVDDYKLSHNVKRLTEKTKNAIIEYNKVNNSVFYNCLELYNRIKKELRGY